MKSPSFFHDDPTGKSRSIIHHIHQKRPLFLAWITLVFLVALPILYFSTPKKNGTTDTAVSVFKDSGGTRRGNVSISGDRTKCDIFKGGWIPDAKQPYYTNNSCWAIHDHQNCMKFGRPDSEFLRWRWKPTDCELPAFNPAKFLKLMMGKSMAFVGDSIARNHMQSLICLLSKVEIPREVSNDGKGERFRRFHYRLHNFTVQAFWSPFLVKAQETDSQGPTNTGLFSLYLDELDESWTSKITNFDYIVISAGHWFFRPLYYYEQGKLVGCMYCLKENITDLGTYYGYRRAFRTAFKAINALTTNFKGTTFLRTFAPSHFENGLWNEGGNCVRTKPFRSTEVALDGFGLEFYLIQLEEFKVAEREGTERGLKYRLMDTTEAMLMRPDGHPGPFGHKREENVTYHNDCVHWCLPGPVDTWNAFLLQMLKVEQQSVLQDHVQKSIEKL